MAKDAKAHPLSNYTVTIRVTAVKTADVKMVDIKMPVGQRSREDICKPITLGLM